MIFVLLAVFIFIFGLIFGSFINALTWRLHEQAELKDKKGKKAHERREALSIVKGRSMCSVCGHELAAKDLVPVVSWLLLGGKCRYCHAPIADNPLVEVSTGILFLVSFAAWPYALHGVELFRFVLWLSFIVGFVALAVYDLRWFLLPDKIVFPLTGLGVLDVVVTAIWSHHLQDLLLPAGGAVIIFGLFWLLYQVSRGGWIGGGDVKLGAVLGLLAGTPFRALTVIFIASVIGTILSIPQLSKGREGLTKRIPFGPSLILATLIVVLFGNQLATWYQGLFLI